MHLIALRTVRYNDRHNIVTCYSAERGRVAFAVNAGAGKGASRLRALLMPLSIVECEADFRPGRDIGTMANVRAITALHGIHSSPVKSTLTLFLAEVLCSVLQEGPADDTVWRYVAEGVVRLDRLEAGRAANFHICFLHGLAQLLGIAPEADEYRPGMVFDMVDGRFRLTPPLHSRYLSAADSRAVWIVSRLTYDNMHRWHLGREQRRQVLDAVLSYYTLHYAGLGGLKSLEVVRALM